MDFPDHRSEPTSAASPGERLTALRIVDANANRAQEGLRVVEEYCRFHLSDLHLSERCKSLRHALADSVQQVPAAELAASRFADADVGAAIELASEDRRGSLADVAAASWQRVEQALRSVEEYGKLLAPELARRAKELRYEAYTVAKACLATADSRERLAGAKLYVLIDGGASRAALAERVSELVAAGVHVIQLRDKNLGDRELLARARVVREHTLGSATLFIMNDRPDLAVLAAADGVHVGQEELSVQEVRQIVGPRLLIGVSTHNIEQARQAVVDGANYLGCGPTFPSGTKSFDQFPGCDFLREVAAEIALPAFAIGGITLINLSQVLAAGFSRVAVSGAMNEADVRAAAKSFLDLLS
jgi:thiamine-phosphate pyrophosphorylase